MSQTALKPIEVKETTGFQMMYTLGIVGCMAGVLIAVAFQATLPYVNIQRAKVLQKAVFKVLPGTDELETYQLHENGELTLVKGEAEKKGRFVYAGYTKANRLVGVAIEAQGQGFQDTIEIIYGYSPERQCVLGMKVLATKETPGLGDKIDSDPAFLANFTQLDVSIDMATKQQVHPVIVVKQGTKSEKWQIDAITGATISSNAIGKILLTSTSEIAPLILNEQNLRRLKERK